MCIIYNVYFKRSNCKVSVVYSLLCIFQQIKLQNYDFVNVYFSYAVIAKECAGCPKIKCERPGCDTFFCYHCKQYWHPNKTCDTARAERGFNDRSGSITYSHDTDSQSK